MNSSWLFLDTAQSGQIRIGWLSASSNIIQEWQSRTHALVGHVREVCEGRRPDGICVVAGPGSFSAVRSGVLVTNLLARWWKVPLVPVSVGESQSMTPDELWKQLDQGMRVAVSYVAPVYDAEPNITIKKG